VAKIDCFGMFCLALALGFVPRVVDFLYPVKLVKCDPERKDVPYRDPKTGFCVVWYVPNEEHVRSSF
jgi:hypothetical protein